MDERRSPQNFRGNKRLSLEEIKAKNPIRWEALRQLAEKRAPNAGRVIKTIMDNDPDFH